MRASLFVLAVAAGCGRLGFGATPPDADPSAPPDAAPSYADLILADDPLGYWRLGEAGGPTAIDATGVRDGIFQPQTGCGFGAPGATIAAPDTAVAMDGGCAVELPIGLPVGGSTPTTVAAWIALPSAGPIVFPHVFTWQVRDIGAPIDGWALLLVDGGDGPALVFERVVDGVNQVVASPVVPRGTFVHVAATYDPSATQTQVFVDGTLAGSRTDVTAPLRPIDPTPYLAGSSSGNRFVGTLDEVAVFDRVLPAARLAAYAAAAP